jgi:hypothetical protein
MDIKLELKLGQLWSICFQSRKIMLKVCQDFDPIINTCKG